MIEIQEVESDSSCLRLYFAVSSFMDLTTLLEFLHRHNSHERLCASGQGESDIAYQCLEIHFCQCQASL